MQRAPEMVLVDLALVQRPAVVLVLAQMEPVGALPARRPRSVTSRKLQRRRRKKEKAEKGKSKAREHPSEDQHVSRALGEHRKAADRPPSIALLSATP